ncbi:type IV pilus biogenesis/stability protein PilW [Colwellia sp. MT41]|uniref:type IV pilus biogenesis/stability protein PilW n=1 Tax=Colwellia sp. MT41 TaxID=58049 RepID=UPI0009FA3164|nr:type IV pilus biogenesis/stability protein PilW [Colwellia sp. MT41]
MAKYILPTILTVVSMSLLSGCVTQSFENNQPIVRNKANRDEMAATRVSLGLGYLRMGNMSQAKFNLDKAKRFSPDLVQVHTAFAHYYETVGESKLAIASFEQALAIQADSADTLNNYGVFLCRQGKVDAAEVQFLKAIAVPSYILVSQSYENLASCYLQINDFEKAEMYFHKAIFHSPNRTKSLLQMVRLQYAMANYQEAKRFLQKFERHTQRFTADSLALAYKLYRQLGQRRTASNYANMLVKMYPQSWESKQYLLNNLNFIEADDLARRYQVSQKGKYPQLFPASNKRVVKLSPRKVGDSPYTTSVKTASLTKNSKALVEVAQVPTRLMTATTAGTSALTMMPATLGSGSALLSATVVATVAAASTPVSQTSVANPEEMTAIAAAAPVVTTSTVTAPVVATSVVVEQSLFNTIEPTSTQPIAATRDVPLPEALPQQLAAEVITPALITPELAITKEARYVVAPMISVDAKDVLHTVISGENLYNISMKYNVKLKALRKWNNISEKNKIHAGDKLYVVDPLTVKNIND